MHVSMADSSLVAVAPAVVAQLFSHAVLVQALRQLSSVLQAGSLVQVVTSEAHWPPGFWAAFAQLVHGSPESLGGGLDPVSLAPASDGGGVVPVLVGFGLVPVVVLVGLGFVMPLPHAAMAAAWVEQLALICAVPPLHWAPAFAMHIRNASKAADCPRRRRPTGRRCTRQGRRRRPD